MTALERAIEFAKDKHATSRKWAGEQLYWHHLADVEATVLAFKPDAGEELRCAAWLHDVVEDCGVSLQEIEDNWGSYVRALVWAVTNGPGANRKERAAPTYARIRSTPGALLVKLADRISNVRASVGTPWLEMYRKEHPAFRIALFNGNWLSMWNELDRLFAAPT